MIRWRPENRNRLNTLAVRGWLFALALILMELTRHA